MAANRILLIEDDDVVIRSVSYTLEQAGYVVESTVSGKLGVETALNSHPDLIICDLILPDINGAEVVLEIRRDPWGKDAKIIILTNIDQEQIKMKLQALSVDRYLVKVENTLKDITNAVNEVIAPNP